MLARPQEPTGNAAAATGGALAIESVSKSFDGFRAVDAVDLDVRAGEFLTLLGPSGSGKTTLLMMIAGFVEPTAGRIRLDGEDITARKPETRGFGMVFQGYALFPHMSVRDNIAYPLTVRKRPRREIAERVDAMLDLVQLGPYAERRPHQLSGGQQQRVALARALAFAPRLLLLDEPLGALDKKLRGEVQEELRDVHARTGTTFVYVTHDQDEALSMSDRVAIMNRGRLVQIGAPGELYERPATRFAAGFLGKSNFVTARVLERDGHALVLDASGVRLHQRAETQTTPGEEVLLALRPEKLALAGDAGQSANMVEATVTRLTYLGATLEVAAEADGIGALDAQLPAWRAPHDLAPGTRVVLGWDEEAAVVVADTE